MIRTVPRLAAPARAVADRPLKSGFNGFVIKSEKRLLARIFASTVCATATLAAARWRALLAAVLLSLALGAVLLGVLAGQRSSVAPATRGSFRGLSSLPFAAQAQISAALGADERAYRISPIAGGFQASNPGQRLHARFGRSGMLVSSHGSEVGLRVRAVGYGMTHSSSRPSLPVAAKRSATASWAPNSDSASRSLPTAIRP